MKKAVSDSGGLLRQWAIRNIKVGEWYTLPSQWHAEARDRDMKCIGKYPHFAQFETEMGIRASFNYFELGTLLYRKNAKLDPPWADPGTQCYHYESVTPTKINSKRKKGGLSLI